MVLMVFLKIFPKLKSLKNNENILYYNTNIKIILKPLRHWFSSNKFSFYYTQKAVYNTITTIL